MSVMLGMRNPDATEPMTADTIFRLFSLTKPITSFAALMLVDQGRMALDDPLGAEATVDYERNCPVTVNHERQTRVAIRAAGDIVGDANVDEDVDPSMAGEDFAFMLRSRPGIFIGNGESSPLHNPSCDFNDDAILCGISYWVRLAEQRLG